jgi:microcystin degradation protein MlrC
MMHETNTFNRFVTTLEDFWLAEKEQIYHSVNWKKSESTQAIINHLRLHEVDIEPTFFARAIPNGIVSMKAYDVIKRNIINGILDAGTIDGILLDLHGSMFVKGIPDPEGDLLLCIRKEIDYTLPIACALDMHATMTRKMICNANAFAAYKTAPHVDAKETGIRAASLLLKSIKEKKALTTQMVQLPILLGGEKSETNEEPMKSLLELLEEKLIQEEILDASYCLGFPWADSPYSNVSVLTIGYEEHKGILYKVANELASEFWAKRYEFDFTTEAYHVTKAFEIAMNDPQKPIIVSDSGDNPTAGASQDMTFILKHLIDNNIAPALISAIADENAYNFCKEYEMGSIIDVKIGRLNITTSEAYNFEQATIRKKTVCQGSNIIILEKNNIQVILSDRRLAVYEPSLIFDLGLNPNDFKIIVPKCGYQGPEFKEIAARSLLAISPGDSSQILEELPYNVTPRPIFPLDKEANFEKVLSIQECD